MDVLKLRLIFAFLSIFLLCSHSKLLMAEVISGDLVVPLTQEELLTYIDWPLIHKKIPMAIRQNYVRLNQDIVIRDVRGQKSLPVHIKLNLSGVIENAVQKRTIVRGIDHFTWIGFIEGDPLSLVVITFKSGKLAASIDFNGKSYSIRSLPKFQNREILVVYEQNLSYGAAFHQRYMNQFNYSLPISVPASVRSEKFASQNKNSVMASDDGSFIDVMVVYTDVAAAASGDIVTEIENDIDYTNEALANSCVSYRYRLVHTEEVSYAENSSSSSYTILGELSSSTDGVIDSIHTARDTYGADLVQIWVNEVLDVCGLGYAPPTTEDMNAIYGFSLKNRNCASGTTAHELGHNMTLSHDRYQENVSSGDYGAGYADGYGFVDVDAKIITIMSYFTECTSVGVSCTRIPYFSNPNIVYQGVQLGKAGIANESHKLNLARATGANYRGAITEYSVDTTSGCQVIANTNADKKVPCFIATAAYGSDLDPRIDVLRKFRGDVLMKSSWGRAFVHKYYQLSPPIALWLEGDPMARFAVRLCLAPIIYTLVHPFLSLLFLSLIIFTVGSFFLFKWNRSRKLTTRLVKFSLLFITILVALCENGWAQMASPSLNYGTLNLNPAVVGMRFSGAVVGAGYKQVDESISIGGRSRETSENNRYQLMAAGGIPFIKGEGYYDVASIRTRKEKVRSSEMTIEEGLKGYGAKVALNVLGPLYVGLGYDVDEETLPPVNQTDTTISLGLGANFFNFLYLGALVQNNSTEKTYHPQMTWWNKGVGASLSTSVSGIGLRGEGSYLMSDKTTKIGGSGEGANLHPATTELNIGAESTFPINDTLIYVGFIKTSKTEKNLSAVSGKDKEIDITTLRGGADLWQKRFLCGVTLATEKQKMGTWQNDISVISLEVALKF